MRSSPLAGRARVAALLTLTGMLLLATPAAAGSFTANERPLVVEPGDQLDPAIHPDVE